MVHHNGDEDEVDGAEDEAEKMLKRLLMEVNDVQYVCICFTMIFIVIQILNDHLL